jgi:alpha/beta superfamily hydrolase
VGRRLRRRNAHEGGRYYGAVSNAATVWIPGPVGRLEGALRTAESPRGAIVLAHPHPLYGGTLHNPVVFHADRELNRAGMTTLRLNFRGVEGSDGFHDDGRGEIGDVAAAAGWLADAAPGAPVILVGYSFGSRCAIAHAINDPSIAGVVAIGLPVRIWAFDDLPALRRPFAVVQGTADEFGSIGEVEAAIGRLDPPGRLYPVPGATHMFPGRAPEAASRVVEAVEEILQGAGGRAS